MIFYKPESDPQSSDFPTPFSISGRSFCERLQTFPGIRSIRQNRFSRILRSWQIGLLSFIPVEQFSNPSFEEKPML